MSTKVKVPGPSQGELQLQQAQAEQLQLQKKMLEEQYEQQKILLPFLMEQEGFDVEMDEGGRVKGIKKRADPDADKRKELERMFLDRSMKAMKGELPVDPALERSLGDQEQQLRERLQAQFGEGYETASPAIETLGEFFRSSEQLREGARTGQLTLSEQLGLTREQQRLYSQQSGMDAIRTGMIGDPLTIAGAFGQSASGFGQAMQPYIQNRSMIANANAQGKSAFYGLIGSGIGALGKIAAAAVPFSDAAGKENLVQVAETIEGLPIYEYNLIGESDRRIGVLSTDVEKLHPDAVLTRMGWDAVDYREFETDEEFW